MSMSSGDHISGSVTGDVTGQVGIGKTISQTQQIGPAPPLTEAERAELAELFAAVKAQVGVQVPDDQRGPALERVQELQEALTAEEPDLGVAHYIKKWFLKRAPTVAGLITGVLVNPLVGKLVQSAGDVAAAELARVIDE